MMNQGSRMQPAYTTPIGSVLRPADDDSAQRSTPVSTRRTQRNLIVGVVVLLVAAVGAKVVWTRMHQTRLQVPDVIAGMQRIDDAVVAQQIDSLEKAAADNETPGKGGVYGYNGVPTVFFFAAVVSGADPHSPDDFFQSFADGFASSGTQSVNVNTKTTDLVGESTFICARIRGKPTGSLCMWRDGKVVGFVMGLGQTIDSTHGLTALVRSLVEG